MPHTRASIGPSVVLRAARRLAAVALLAFLALMAVGPVRAEAVSFEVKGQWLCNNEGTVTPIAGARVELWEPGGISTLWIDEKLGSTHTASNGTYSFKVEAGDNFELYTQVVLNDDQGVNLGEWYAFSDWSAETETTTSHSGVVNLGTYEIYNENGKGTPDCAVWQGAHSAYQNYKQVIGKPPPDSQYTIDADFPCCGVPFTTLDSTHWPGNFPTGYKGDPDGGYSTNFHEFAHSVRHSFDGSYAHFLFDAARFGYIKNHELCLVSNEGFAFNEGWAEFWARTPATCGDGTNFSQEGNVATALTGLENCSNRKTMVRVLSESAGLIHSYADFKQKWLELVGPRACLLKSLTGNLGVEKTIAAAPLLAHTEQQISGASQLIAGKTHGLALARTRAQSPGRCTKGHCLTGLEKLIQPSALSTEVAQAKLVRERLQSGLAAARAAVSGPESAQLKFYETLEAEQKAFELANQAILIAGLKQGIAAIRSNPGFVVARSTAAYRTLTKRLQVLTSAHSRRAVTPGALASLFSPPIAASDGIRRVGAH